MNASHPLVGAGLWTIVNGSAVIHNPSLANSFVSYLGAGVNGFKWEVTNLGCTSSDMVYVNSTPPPATAGYDQTICHDSATLAANMPPAGYIGQWEITMGSATIANPSYYNTLVSNL